MMGDIKWKNKKKKKRGERANGSQKVAFRQGGQRIKVQINPSNGHCLALPLLPD